MDRSGSRFIKPADQIEDRALAGTVRAYDREDLTGLDLERDVLDGMDATELDRQVPDDESLLARHRNRSVLR